MGAPCRLFFLIWLAYRGGSVLLLAPAAALVAAAVTREPLLATWMQTFMAVGGRLGAGLVLYKDSWPITASMMISSRALGTTIAKGSSSLVSAHKKFDTR
jgi:hypothetical protein